MNTFIIILVCFLAGAGAGIGTGFAGMSAAAIIGPILVTFLHLTPYDAIGIGLISDVLASAISAYTYKKEGNLNAKDSLIMMISVLITTIIGSYLAQFLPDHTMGISMQIALIVIGLIFLFKPIPEDKKKTLKTSKKEELKKSILGVSFVGLVCGTFGAGGGMLMLFVLTTFLGYQVHIAVGTSVFIMTFTALTGGISHFVLGGLPDLFILLLCITFTLLWARIAAVIANKVSAKTLNRVVGIIMIATSIIILFVNSL